MSDNLRPCPFCETLLDRWFPPELQFRHDIRGCVLDGRVFAVENWNNRPIEDELNRRIAKAKDLLNAEMGQWRSVPTGNLPDHFIQLRQVLDVLDGGGE